MDKQGITIDELLDSINACVHGDDCEKCIECGNLRERFCWVNLMRKTAEVLEQLKQREKFYIFLWNTIQPNEMEAYLSMYNSGDEKEES
jgi:hypothetical protein